MDSINLLYPPEIVQYYSPNYAGTPSGERFGRLLNADGPFWLARIPMQTAWCTSVGGSGLK